MSAADKKSPNSFEIPANHPWANLWKLFAGVAVVGLLMAGASVAMGGDTHRFAFSYLAAFGWGLTIALGCMFFVMVQHVANAGWSVVVRRLPEHGMMALPVFALLFLPILGLREQLYHEWMAHDVHDPAIVAKQAFLNFPFWLVRAVVYFAIWTFLSYRLYSLSREQDRTKAPALTLKMVTLSAPGIPLFALTTTFAGIDWIMSIEPRWYSTMYGVYIFAGAVVSMFALLNLAYSRANAAGLTKGAVTTEHFHDLGKLMFAFTFFWGYIAFSQYLLYWYANIPEETEFYLHRGSQGWQNLSWVLVFGHFVAPFMLMLSRHAKRTFPGIRQAVAAWILLVHYLDIYWLVMPSVEHHFHVNPLMDLGCLLLIAGILFAFIFKRMTSAPIIPVGDPRLGRSLHFENA